MTLRRRVVLVLGAVLIGLALAACARVQPHFALPALTLSDPSFIPTVEAFVTASVASGNTIHLLLNGDQIFPAQLDAIRSARTTITYAQYYYEDSPIAREIVEAFADRCRAGVRAHILLDGFGTLTMPAEAREAMKSAGCEVATFRPLSPLLLLSPFGFGKDNRRNHRRILVIDGRVGFTGGSGLGPKWMGNGRTKGQWRETDVRLEGPGVEFLQGAFAETWLEATGNVLGGESYFPQLSPRGQVAAQVIRSSPAGGSFAMYTMFLLVMSSARRSIYITNPYFVPDDRMMRALTEASKRGVRVVLLLPGAIDNNLVRQASRSKFGELFGAGIEIHEYEAGLLHAKTMIVDGIWATIGSTNLDNRSFALNEELNVVVYDKEVSNRLEGVFADDLAHSRKIHPRRWRARGLVDRLLELLSLPIRDQI